MHTFKRNGIYIHHNGDFTGDTIVSKDASPANIEIEIPCSMLLVFPAEYVRYRKIGAIEQMRTDDLLLGQTKETP